MKRYALFFAKCILMLIPLFVIEGFTLLFPMCYMDEEYPSWHYTKMVEEGRVRPVSSGEASVILGDSRAMADMIPGMMGDSYVNLGVGGATPVEMYFTLDKYIKNNGAPKEVMIMFAPFHYSYMDNYKTRTMYFKHLTLKEAMQVYSQGKTYEAAVFDDFDRADILSMYAGLPDSYLPALINAKVTGRLSKNTMLYDEQLANRGHALYGRDNGNSDVNYEANYEHMNRDGEHLLITYYFEKLLKLCSANGIRTIVLQPPMNEASFEALNEGYVREYLSYLNQIRNDNPDIVFEDEIPCYENRYFGDSSHLNEEGARVYTGAIIDKYIKQTQ
ncbi:MAG: hypothetical protein K6E63_02805 [Lachnospiraceae bacterium]|nr:hypothetical protein [Lachnospiraceae bacterium]